MTTPDITADMKHYALMIDPNSHFDCIVEGDNQDDLIAACEDYIQEFPEHKILFCFHGTIIDMQNVVENFDQGRDD